MTEFETLRQLLDHRAELAHIPDDELDALREKIRLDFVALIRGAQDEISRLPEGNAGQESRRRAEASWLELLLQTVSAEQ